MNTANSTTEHLDRQARRAKLIALWRRAKTPGSRLSYSSMIKMLGRLEALHEAAGVVRKN